ncbi:MAG: hypothetical protein ICV81_09865 [Flavisolibacter sp.]|nr:hypothetical protein [Flavisolibacter sp.]
MQKLVLTIFFLISLTACSHRRTGEGDKVDSDRIYFDYKIHGEEDKDEVTCLLQFHYNSPRGNTVLLEKPSTVKLDGEEISADSTPMTGAFYEIQKPRESFAGRHTITFIDLNNKQYKEEFSFTPFTLRTDLPEVVKRQDLQLSVDGVKDTDSLGILLTDTSFVTDDVQAVLNVSEGKLHIPLELWQHVSSGPVNMQLFKEEERPINRGTKNRGQITIAYRLNREFILED